MAGNHGVPTSTGIGQTVRDWLEEEGVLEEVEEAATQEAIAWQIEREMITTFMDVANLPRKPDIGPER